MAYITICVPSGRYCNNCRFLQPGTVLCTAFCELVEETADCTNKIKCDSCKKNCIEINYNRSCSMEIVGDNK